MDNSAGSRERVTVETIVNAPLAKVWESWNEPKHIVNWAFASDDWEAPQAENDLQIEGKFKTTMAAKDGSARFDFSGTYTDIQDQSIIEYDMDKSPDEANARHVRVEFLEVPDGTKIIETFDPEDENSVEMQKDGWQSILNNFKKYVEAN